jgi:Lar family restriction alleviation protein
MEVIIMKDTKINLKYCPFCGEDNARLKHTIDRESYVECESCFAQTTKFEMSYSYSSDEKAIEAWNKRADEDNMIDSINIIYDELYDSDKEEETEFDSNSDRLHSLYGKQLLEFLSTHNIKVQNPVKDLTLFEIKLCDSKIDRDFECFSKEAIFKMKDMFIGKTGFISNNLKGRLFHTYYKTTYVKDFKNDILCCTDHTDLIGVGFVWTHMYNNAKEVVPEFEYNIIHDGSISCSCNVKMCSICSGNTINKKCEHIKGNYYRKQYANTNKIELCYNTICDITDIYEWSFTYPPYLSKTLVGENKT